MTHLFSLPMPSGLMNRLARANALAAFVLVCATGVAAEGPPPEGAPRLRVERRDRIVFIGNTFAERMALFAHFETLVTALHPEHGLAFRNLGWSGDTLTLQPRPLNFGDMDNYLERHKADVIIACFGMNESFEGRAGLSRFEQDWRDFLQHMSEARFNGESAPRIAIISPIAHEALGGKLPDPGPHNENLNLYTESMRKIAAEHELPFADLFTSTKKLAGDGPRLTRNGIHVTQYGDWVAAQIMARELGLVPRSSEALTIDAAQEQLPIRFELAGQTPLPAPPVADEDLPVDLRPLIIVKGLEPGRYVLQVEGAPAASGEASDWAEGVRIRRGPTVEMVERLRQAIIEKEQQFFYRRRAVNGEYIYGRRAEPFGVINFPDEMKALDGLVADLDGRIWRLSKALRGRSYELVKTSD